MTASSFPVSAVNSIALLIDADNSPAAKIDFVMSELASHGMVNIRRAYGNWKKPTLVGWERILHENSIQPVQAFDLVKGKNAADMALVIDALDILYTKNVGTFCLVSSDCDFTPLIQRLRADGKQVLGFGQKSTPEPFVNACNLFFYLDEDAMPKKAEAAKGNEPVMKPEAKAVKEEQAKTALKSNTKLMNILRIAVRESADEEGWARLGPVGSRITNAGSLNHRSFGFSKLSDLFKAIDLFEVKSEKMDEMTVVSVKLKKGGKPVAG